MRKYPQPSDYQGAIQNPHIVFSDPELRVCRVRKNPLGIPAVSAGGFALSFYLEAPSGDTHVVRCFKADSPDRQARYAAISRFLNDNAHPIFLDVDFLERGILVNGEWYPIVRMPYVRGMTFQRYIEGEVTAKHSIADLPQKFRRMVDTLEKLGVAHGDLQHGNIMVQNGELVLVDYDGMYVPALKNHKGAESGNAAYQHPGRNDQFGPELDRFSAIVIDMALRALAVNPDLWTKYSNGDNMLFRAADFDEPDKSKLLRELEALPGLREQVGVFRSICKGPLENVPRLNDFAAGKKTQGPLTVADWLPRKRQVIYDAHKREELLALVGTQVTVVGKIVASSEGHTFRGDPYVFLNFGNYRDSHLTLVIWSDELQLFQQQNKRVRDYVEQWVQVNGMLTMYKPTARDVQPQIVIDVPTQIELLQGGEAEARRLLADVGTQARVRPTIQLGAVAPAQPATAFPPPSTPAQSPPPAQPPAPPPASAPPVPQPSPAMAALGLYALSALIDFGQVRAIDVLSRQLRVFNANNHQATVSISGMDPYLTTTPPVFVCLPHSAVDITVRLDAARVPPGALQRVAGTSSQGPTFALQGASLLLKCSGASQVIPVSVTIMHAAAPQSQPAPSGVSAPAQPAKTTPIAAAPPSAPRPTAPPPSQASPLAGAAAVQPAAGSQVNLSAQAQSSPQPAPSVPAAQTVSRASTQASPGGSTQSTVQPPVKSRSRSWNIAAWAAAAALCIAYFGSFGSFDAALTQWRNYLAATIAPPTQAAPSQEEPATGGAAPGTTPLATDAATSTASVASLCPVDLPVELAGPSDFVIADTVTFAWQAGAVVPRDCLFQIKVWRDGRPRITVDASGAAAGAGNRYEHQVALGGILPAGERRAGLFSWTVELTLGDATGEALPTAAGPATFYWMPETSTDAQ
jgi:hypothetical protein